MPTGAAATALFPPNAMTFFLHHPPIASNYVKAGEKLLPQAIADPLNPQSWKGGRGHAVSALEMPQAPLQPGWDCPQAPEIPAKEIIWKSERLKNSRRVWIFTTGDATAEERPLAVLLDGEFWAQSMPVWPVLTSLTHRQQLPPAVYVLIDAIDTTHRAHELPCNADFWLAVQQELLPLVKAIAPFSDRADRTVSPGRVLVGCPRCMPDCTGLNALAVY